MLPDVDPFIGTEAIDLPVPRGIAATWFYIKAQIANNHPGPSLPFSPMSVCPCSGGYPSGYGRYEVNSNGPPPLLHDERRCFGATHLHHAGTGYIGFFYNYLLTVPFHWIPKVPRIDLRKTVPDRLVDERARPGYYAATLSDTAVKIELTAGRFAAAHRYTPTEDAPFGVLVDVTHGGLANPRAQARPADLSIRINSAAGGTSDANGDSGSIVSGSFVHAGVRWFFAVVATADQGLTPRELFRAPDRVANTDERGWVEAELLDGITGLSLDGAELETTRAGFCWMTDSRCRSRRPIELFVGMSVDSDEAALGYALEAMAAGFDAMRERAEDGWDRHFSAVEVTGGDDRLRRIFHTSHYHASLKPCRGETNNHLWRAGPELWTGLATMWDQYKTELPFLLTVYPDHAVSFAASLEATRAALGRFPNAVMFSNQHFRFEKQSRNIAVVMLYDIYTGERSRGEMSETKWLTILASMAREVERESVAIDLECEQGYSHILDVSYAAVCVAKLARDLGRTDIEVRMATPAERWREAFDPETGLLRESDYYEGANTHYSFRLLHDMRSRIELAGGAKRFGELLDRFFGFGAEPVSQIGSGTSAEAGIALGRFDGLNNEVMLETPFAYHYIGNPDRTSEIVSAIQRYQFSDTPGGIPGNDDSGALSSWFFWNAVGLFPVPGQGLYLLSVPLFDRAIIRSCGLTIEVERIEDGDGAKSIFLASASLNGVSLDRTFITSGELWAGGVLRLRLSCRPGRFTPARLPGA